MAIRLRYAEGFGSTTPEDRRRSFWRTESAWRLSPRSDHRRRFRRRANFFERLSSTELSAHIGREVVVHYRWRPYFGRRLRLHYSENRKKGVFVHVEVMPGVVTAIAAWMLDPACCAGMELGTPRVSLPALMDLDDLLQRRGMRRTCLGEPNLVEEHQDARSAISPSTTSASAPDLLRTAAPSRPPSERTTAAGVEPCRASHRGSNRYEGGPAR